MDQKATLSRDDRGPALHMRPFDIRRIAAINLVAGEGYPAHHQLQRQRIRDLASSPATGYTPPDPEDLKLYSADELLEIRKMVNEHMTPEERNLKSLSTKATRSLPNAEEWIKADFTQLNAHFDSGTIGKAVPKPRLQQGDYPQVYRGVWSRSVKHDGRRKSRLCLDGSKRAAPWLRLILEVYSSCIETPCVRLFLAESVNRGFGTSFADVDNAFQQSPPPSVACFLAFDEVSKAWYKDRFGEELDWDNYAIPLLAALQGHPEASASWERMITDILVNKMGFRHTTHE